MRPGVPQSLDLNMSLQSDAYHSEDDITPTSSQQVNVSVPSGSQLSSTLPHSVLHQDSSLPTFSVTSSEFSSEGAVIDSSYSSECAVFDSSYSAESESGVSCSTGSSMSYPASSTSATDSDSEEVGSDSDPDGVLLTPTNSTFLQTNSITLPLRAKLIASQLANENSNSCQQSINGNLDNDPQPNPNGMESHIKPSEEENITYLPPNLVVIAPHDSSHNSPNSPPKENRLILTSQDPGTVNSLSTESESDKSWSRKPDVVKPLCNKTKRVNFDQDPGTSCRPTVARSQSQRKLVDQSRKIDHPGAVMLKRRSTFSNRSKLARGSEGDVLSSDWSPFLMRRASELAHKVFSYSRSHSLDSQETVPSSVEDGLSEEGDPGIEVDGLLKSLTRRENYMSSSASPTTSLVSYLGLPCAA